ncbi:hypothetical protein LINPERHAP1_LOCUS15779 [Linum perenne]
MLLTSGTTRVVVAISLCQEFHATTL